MSKTDSNEQTQKPKISRLAILSLVLGITWVVFLIQWSISMPVTLSIFVGLGIVGVILGIGALIGMHRKEGVLRGQGFAVVGIVGSIICVFFMGCSLLMGYEMKLYRAEYFGHKDKRLVCRRHLSELNTAISVHANPAYDYRNDKRRSTGHPLKWCDLLLGWHRSLELLICPAAKKGPCSYAINKYALEVWEDIPQNVVKLFESKSGWNQIGGPELLGTNNHNGEGCNVLFGNNTVKFIKTEHLGELRWKVEEGEGKQVK